MEKNSIWTHELVKAEKEFSYHRFKIVTMGAPVIEANQKLLLDFLLGGGGDSMHCSDGSMKPPRAVRTYVPLLAQTSSVSRTMCTDKYNTNYESLAKQPAPLPSHKC